MVKCIIIDDEPKARKAISNMLEFYCPEVKVLGEAEDVKSGLIAIQKYEPDLLLLDVNLPDGTGFDLLNKLHEIDFAIIFFTAHAEYALQAIKFSALDYLLKPVQPDELKSAIARAVKSKKEELILKLKAYSENTSEKSSAARKIVLNTATNIYIINTEDILRCEADENYTIIYVLNREKIIVAKTLKEFDELLSPFGFFRVHQSHIVNLSFVDNYMKGLGGSVVMKNKEKVPVSARRKDMFLKVLAAN